MFSTDGSCQTAVVGTSTGWGQSCCQDVPDSICCCLSWKYFLCSWMACSSRGMFIPSTQVNIRAFITGLSPGNIEEASVGREREVEALWHTESSLSGNVHFQVAK